MADQMTKTQVNLFGLSKADYRGNPSTLCQGCGHNSISSQIIAACYEMNILPENVVKFSGIGCSSKSPTYFLNRSFGFNGLHGRMPSLATGALFGDYTLHGIGVSGDGDSASIGMGQFKHVVRRNLNMVYIIENNGVYGLTKGQFSATAEKGLQLKSQGTNPYMPIDIAWEALVGNATFVGRSFAGDPRSALHSYAWGKEHEVALHELSFVPPAEDITVEYDEGEAKEVTLHDGSRIILKKLEHEYDPHDRTAAMRILEEANAKQWLITGLIYISPTKPNLVDLHNLSPTPLNRLPENRIRPAKDTIEQVNNLMF
ncbi:MAG: 2-oxoglutarate/2-oxoacid ferredoxin oxidoreductase subunit beta [Chloroflexi bacterium]|nr:2-oxoglutarate/2-oxoacid ferredoxin oxidoreductase subunit beta [Chloroflexota bacterium]